MESKCGRHRALTSCTCPIADTHVQKYKWGWGSGLAYSTCLATTPLSDPRNLTPKEIYQYQNPHDKLDMVVHVQNSGTRESGGDVRQWSETLF